MQSLNLLLKVEEVAAQLGLGRSMVWRLLRDGELRAVHVGRAVRIPADSVRAYVQRLQDEWGDA